MTAVQLSNLFNQLNISMGLPFKKVALGWPSEVMAAGRDNNYPDKKAFPFLVIAPFRGIDTFDGERLSTTYTIEMYATALQGRTNENTNVLDTLQTQWTDLHEKTRKYVATLQYYALHNGLAEISEPTFEFDSNSGPSDRLVSIAYRFNVVTPYECTDSSDLQDTVTALDALGYNSTQTMPSNDLEQLTKNQLRTR